MDTETISAFRFPFSAFRFRLYWLFCAVRYALQDAGGYAISRQNNLELHLGCHTWWLSYLHRYAFGADGRSLGRSTVSLLPNFLGWIDFLTHGAPLRALHARESSAIIKADKQKFSVKIFGDVCNQEPITWSIGHMCCTLEATHSRKELFTEQAFPRE